MILILMVEGASATLISVRTCTPTPSCPEAPPCTPVSPTGCRRRSPPWLPPPSRSRSLLPPRGSTPSGSEDPSWLPSPPSSRCGSPSRSTTSADPPLSTASASNSSFPSFHQIFHQRSKYIPSDNKSPMHYIQNLNIKINKLIFRKKKKK